MKTIYLFGDSIGQGVVADENGRYHICKNSWAALLEANHYLINNYSGLGYTHHFGFLGMLLTCHCQRCIQFLKQSLLLVENVTDRPHALSFANLYHSCIK